MVVSLQQNRHSCNFSSRLPRHWAEALGNPLFKASSVMDVSLLFCLPDARRPCLAVEVFASIAQEGVSSKRVVYAALTLHADSVHVVVMLCLYQFFGVAGYKYQELSNFEHF